MTCACASAVDFLHAQFASAAFQPASGRHGQRRKPHQRKKCKLIEGCSACIHKRVPRPLSQNDSVVRQNFGIIHAASASSHHLRIVPFRPADFHMHHACCSSPSRRRWPPLRPGGMMRFLHPLGFVTRDYIQNDM